VAKKARNNIVITAVVLALGAGLLIWAAMDSQWVQTVSAQDVINNLQTYKSKSLQIFGKVAVGSVKEENSATEFDLYWPKDKEMSSQTLHVKYTGLSKVNLTGGSDVLIDCKVNEQGQVNASRILTKCPSKYKSVTADEKNTLSPQGADIKK
jgi:cytochrome c-type biogenesis protein CcmE